jgi:hypothetical protein
MGVEVKAVNGAGTLLGDVAVVHEFADDGAVFAFSQGVVIGLPEDAIWVNSVRNLSSILASYARKLCMR